ncbi:MAG: ABC transporter ATP-binding protein [Clostridia bacterium]|nr:ABC transporter ATP-binding protein [Clostridia bacterium]
MIAIKTEGLTKKYKDIIAVNNLNLEIKKGELFSLLGVNGAGKTTTVKMLCGLTAVNSGNAFLNGNSILTDSSKCKKFISVSPQETAVAPNLTVKENLKLICEIYGFKKEKCENKINELVNQFDLSAILNKKAGKLSGGWQRRLSIALSLISEPEILFLDEPTLGLDVLARSDLWDIINSLKGKITLVLTTHYMEEAEVLSDRIGIMKNGRLVACDTPDRLKEKTATETLEKAFIKIVKGENI